MITCGSNLYLQSNEEEEKRKKRKRKDPSPSPSTSSITSTDSSRSGVPPSKKKKRNRVSGKSPAPSNTSHSRSRTPASDTPKLNRTTSHESNEGLGCCEEILEEEEEESECSAAKCLQPMVDEISWVQCDKCQEWFHCMCVGLTKEIAEKIDSYVCENCKQSNSKPSSVTGSNVSGVKSGGGGGGVVGGASSSNVGLLAALKHSTGLLQAGHNSLGAVRITSNLQT